MYFGLFHLPLSHSGSGGDYTSLSIDLTFNSVTISQMVTVATSTDTVIEDEETFTLSLTENDDAVNMLTPQSATVTITDQTSKYIHCPLNRIEEYVAARRNLIYCVFSSALTFGFDPSVYSVMEGESEMVTVTVMGGTLDRDMVVTVMTVDGNAVGADGMM